MREIPQEIADFCIERVLQIPDATHAMLEILINDHGVELSADHNTFTHQERVKVIREIIAAVAEKERTQ